MPSSKAETIGDSGFGGTQSSDDGGKRVQPTATTTGAPACSSEHKSLYRRGSEQTPRSLINTGYHKWSSFTLDVVLCLLPIAFVVITTLALSLHHAPRSPSGDRVQSYILLAPTIFPIVYAAILGRTLRRVGLYMAEKGSTVGTLERVIGCQSLFSAIERQYTLRHFDVLGVLILLVWLLSPVGGQSSLRLLTNQPQMVYSITPAWYYPMQAYIWASLLGFNNAMRFHHISVPYMAALQSSSQTINSSRDMWGNLKIPDIKYLDGYQANKSIGTWLHIGNDTQLTYTSLLGMPIFGISTPGNSTFNLTSHYWSIDCEKASGNYSRTPWLSSETELSTYALITFNESLAAGARTVYSSRKPLTKGSTLSGNITETYVVSATCYAQPIRVETHIACWGTTCRAQAMRELDWNQLDDQRLILYSNYTDILRNMTTADKANAEGAATQSQMTETFIAGQILLAGYATSLDGSWVDIETLSKQVLSSRLQQAINTYWDASVGNMHRSWEHQPDDRPPEVCIVRQRECRSRKLNWNVTEFHSEKHSGEQYACNSGYAVITIAISCFLFLAAVLSLILGIITTAPDILGFVSTAARNNVYFEDRVPSYFDGLEATRALKDIKVRIGDVAGDNEVGRVAFTSLESASRRLVRDRLYD
ncbi:hypothetical protein BU25DRAFT_345329 [Macroventuria anomochaeta]|uniref:Uncharacterized protein n=1 Tax=Macroventuria anomochaeta TaxID=301207 RepID=A0ACB6RW98_9PLEO|nr:uncharacterized protein BU25DRAFT_345329 [Macroventuria anomochaeta]KAF2625690.1 hypothetical protein BU25DRAFT_345329 [Macroventuria anomochaeta]